MSHAIIELLQPVKLEKAGHEPLVFELGEILKVVEELHDKYLVSTDHGFTFTVAKENEGKTWKSL